MKSYRLGMRHFVVSGAAGIAATAMLLYPSTAATINVDFNSTGGSSGTFAGTAAAPDSGTIWNGFAIDCLRALTVRHFTR